MVFSWRPLLRREFRRQRLEISRQSEHYALTWSLFAMLVTFPATAQQGYTVALAAVASDKEHVGASTELLGKVETVLNNDRSVRILGQPMTGVRSDISNERVWQYGNELGANGAVVLQYKSTEPHSGTVLLWTSQADYPSGKPSLTETIGPLGVQPEQVSRIAALVKQTASHGEEIAVELHIVTKPPRTSITVGDSQSELTDDHGEYRWIGTQSTGVIPVRAFNEPDYVPAAQNVQVRQNPDGGLYRENLLFKLKHRARQKTPR